MAMLGEAIPHTLPWYFGAAALVLWLAAVGGVVVVLRIRLRGRAERRRRPAPRSERRHPPDDRALGPGTDVEPW